MIVWKHRIRGRIYATRHDARSDVFNYIEMSYNTRRQHSHNDDLASGRVRKASINLRHRGVYRSRGDSPFAGMGLRTIGEQAMREFKALLNARIKEGLAGRVSNKQVGEILDDEFAEDRPA